MKFSTNKDKGNTGLCIAIAYYNKSTLNLCDKYDEFKIKV